MIAPPNPLYWHTVDGHTYRSIPVPLVVAPQRWPYAIHSEPYGKTGKTWRATCDGQGISSWGYPRKCDAEAAIRKHAAGEEVIHIA